MDRKSDYSKVELSVFFPAYNEEENIPTTVEKAVTVLKGLNLKAWEILVINDGSKDKTLEVSEKLAQKYSQVKVINQSNGGYGMALRAGFKNAKYELIVYNDADGQFDFSEVTRFLDKIPDYDLLIGYRIKRNDHLIRLLFAKGWALALLVTFGLRLKDVDCGFKMVRKQVLDKIPPLESTRGGMINAELAVKAKKFGFREGQVGVNHYARVAGQPTGANFKVILQSFIDLFKLRLKLL